MSGALSTNDASGGPLSRCVCVNRWHINNNNSAVGSGQLLGQLSNTISVGVLSMDLYF